MEMWPRGRRHSPAKGAYGPKLVSRVRIPSSPPEFVLVVRESNEPVISHGCGGFFVFALLLIFSILGKCILPVDDLFRQPHYFSRHSDFMSYKSTLAISQGWHIRFYMMELIKTVLPSFSLSFFDISETAKSFYF